MNELIEQNIATSTGTMTSSQLAVLLGKEKSYINRAIKNMFPKEIDDASFAPSLDSRGYVDEYNIPELESKMFVATKDQKYLREITQYWIDRTQNMLTPAEQLLANAQRLVDHERKLKNLEHLQRETSCQVKALVDGEDFFTIVGYANVTGKKVDIKVSSKLGRQASSECKNQGIEKGEAHHPVYGKCGTYPREVLAEVFNKHFGEQS